MIIELLRPANLGGGITPAGAVVTLPDVEAARYIHFGTGKLYQPEVEIKQQEIATESQTIEVQKDEPKIQSDKPKVSTRGTNAKPRGNTGKSKTARSK